VRGETKQRYNEAPRRLKVLRMRVEFTFRGLTPSWRSGRNSDQFVFTPVDPVYIDLRNGRAAGIFFGFVFEKQIPTSEITHEALTNRRIAARIRSPLAPAATQTAFKVIIRQTPSANKVETAILESFMAKENSVSDGRVSLRKLYLLESQDEDSLRFLDTFANN
jgi:hypothetical protein